MAGPALWQPFLGAEFVPVVQPGDPGAQLGPGDLALTVGHEVPFGQTTAGLFPGTAAARAAHVDAGSSPEGAAGRGWSGWLWFSLRILWCCQHHGSPCSGGLGWAG